MLPAGKYYVGDLGYVMHPQWDEFCMITCGGNEEDGVFALENGVKFASFSTKYGDGTYEDQFGNKYSVDAGLIGCILVSDINDNSNNGFEGGQIIDFEKDFEVSSEDGIIDIGHISINTNGTEIHWDGNEDTYDD